MHFGDDGGEGQFALVVSAVLFCVAVGMLLGAASAAKDRVGAPAVAGWVRHWPQR